MPLLDGSDVLDDEMVEVLRRKTGTERMQIAFGLFEAAHRMLTSHLQHQHPDWDEERVREEVARRISRGVIDAPG